MKPTQYFKREIKKNKILYFAESKNIVLKVVKNSKNPSIEIINFYDLDRLKELNTIIECSADEFERVYVEIHSQIHLQFISTKNQSRDELIKNLQISMDQVEF